MKQMILNTQVLKSDVYTSWWFDLTMGWFTGSVKLTGLKDAWRIGKALFWSICTRVFSVEVSGVVIGLSRVGSSSTWVKGII